MRNHPENMEEEKRNNEDGGIKVKWKILTMYS